MTKHACALATIVYGWAQQPQGDSIFLLAVATVYKLSTEFTHRDFTSTNSVVYIHQTNRFERLRFSRTNHGVSTTSTGTRCARNSLVAGAYIAL